jgi:hypothetical protein
MNRFKIATLDLITLMKELKNRIETQIGEYRFHLIILKKLIK